MVAGARGPDGSGFPDFYRDEWRRTLRSVVPIVGAAAEDVAQEAFVAALGRWVEVAALDAPGAWVRLVARRIAWRRRGREMDRVEREPAAAVMEPEAVDPETRLDLGDALRSLPSNQRMAVRLYYLADLPVGVIAELLRVRESTVKVWLHRARIRLADTLSGVPGRWVSEHRWSRDAIVGRLRATGDSRFTEVVLEEVPTRNARWVFTLARSGYDISTDEGERLDRGSYRVRRGSLELTPWDQSGTIDLLPEITRAGATFGLETDTTAPTQGVADEVYLRLLLEADRFVRADPAAPP